MPVYKIIIEMDHPENKNELMDYVEYIQSDKLIDAAQAGHEDAINMDGELKYVGYACPTPRRLDYKDSLPERKEKQ